MAIVTKEDEEITEKWRKVFLTPDGKEVLAEILVKMHVFDSLHEDSPAEVAMENFGKWMLFKLGMYQDRNIPGIIDKMAEMPYKESM